MDRTVVQDKICIVTGANSVSGMPERLLRKGDRFMAGRDRRKLPRPPDSFPSSGTMYARLS
jgi:hypothetical protein